MGAFFTNLHVRNAATEAVCSALPELTDSRAYVSPPANGWVTVYTEATEDQDDRKLHPILKGLSGTLQTHVIAFLVHDSDIAMYWLYRNGELVDEFNSNPDYFGERITDATRDRLRGQVDALLPLCVEGTMPEQLDEILHPPDGPASFAEDVVAELAKLLGIDATRAILGFNYFDEEGEDALPDAHEFQPVGSGAERKEERANSQAARTAIPTPDTYPSAITILTQTWNTKFAENDPKIVSLFGKGTDSMIQQVRAAFDQQARMLLKQSKLPDLPTFEDLIAARNNGPEALAKLIAKKTPGQLAEIGVSATVYGLSEFVAALLSCGLDPNAPDRLGETVLRAAEQRHGVYSSVYRLVKSAVERRGT